MDKQNEKFENLLNKLILDGKIVDSTVSSLELETLHFTSEEYYRFIMYLGTCGVKVEFVKAEVSDSLEKMYIHDICYSETISADEVRALIIQYRKTNDKKLKDRVIESFLPLVLAIVSHYEYTKGEVVDLIQEGNEGLLEAFDKFDLNRGTAFSTCAVWYIRKHIVSYLINYCDTIRLPAHLQDDIHVMKKAIKQLSQKLFRLPTNEELSEFTGLSLRDIERAKRCQIPVLSYDARVSSEYEAVELVEFIDDIENDDVFEEKVQDELLYASIYKEIEDVLNEKELYIVKAHQGVDRDDIVKLKDLGMHFGISGERARQIESEAYSKIRNRLLAIGIENPYGQKSSNTVYVRKEK